MRRLVPALLTLAACQQTPAPGIDLSVDNLTRGAVAVAPPPTKSTTATPAYVGAKIERPDLLVDKPTLHLPTHVPPTFSLQTGATLSPSGNTSKSMVDAVTVSVDMIGTPATELAVEFVSPSGTPYERRTVQATGSVDDAQHFDFVLPVAGTWIDSQAITGQWTARIFLAGAEQPAATFTIDP